jgi:carboxyl-terminal processing protease
LQDHDRALIIGQPTYGKGVGQEVMQLPDGYAMKFTTMRWYTPLGRSIQRPHKLLPTGEYAEPSPDSLETVEMRAKRPTLKSESGRVVYGGGGVVPEVLVQDIDEGTRQLYFDSALKSNAWPMQSVLSSYAAAIAPTAPKTLKITPAMRTQFLADLRANGIVLPASLIKTRGKLLDRMIAERVAFANGGMAAARRVSLDTDVSLTKAITVLSQSTSQTDVFARAAQLQ